MKKLFLPAFALALLVCVSSAAAQSGKALAELKQFSDKQFGTNDFLVNGWKYFPAHFNAKGNPYFGNLDWQTGSVTTTGGETFSNLDLLYNIQMDELVLSASLNSGLPAFVMLNKDFVKSFSIGEYNFVKAGDIYSGDAVQGFVEIIFTGNFIFFAKHKKSFVASYTANAPRGYISGQNTENYLLADDQLTKVPAKRALFRIFPGHKREIKSFIRKNKIKYKKATTAQLKKLIQFCDTL